MRAIREEWEWFRQRGGIQWLEEGDRRRMCMLRSWCSIDRCVRLRVLVIGFLIALVVHSVFVWKVIECDAGFTQCKHGIVIVEPDCSQAERNLYIANIISQCRSLLEIPRFHVHSRLPIQSLRFQGAHCNHSKYPTHQYETLLAFRCCQRQAIQPN